MVNRSLTLYGNDSTQGAAWMNEFAQSLKGMGDTGMMILLALQQQGSVSGQGFSAALATMGYAPVIGSASSPVIEGVPNRNTMLVGVGNETLVAGNGDDLLIAGKGQETLEAGSGNDTFIFNPGSGQVVIDDASTLKAATTNLDELRLGVGITPAGTQISEDFHGGLVLSFGNGDQVTIKGYFTNPAARPAIMFADGTRWDDAAVTANPIVLADTSAGGQIFYAPSGAYNTIVGGLNDTITAGSLNDTITAGQGDTLYAGAGVDTFIFSTGDGAVTLYDAVATKTAGTNQDVLKLGAAITAATTQISRDLSNNLVLAFGNGDQVTIEGYFANTGNDLIIAFADGTSWNVAAIASQLVFRDTTSGGQTLTGANGINNTIVGGLNDTIIAGNLSDTITAGKGDTFDAGTGVDTFIVNSGCGAVVLNESWSKTAGKNQDVVKLGSGITATGTTITRDLSNDLVLGFGNGDQLTITGYFYGASSQPSIAFADGTIWNFNTIASQLVFTDTSAGGNYLMGLAGVNNTIVGAPNDTIFAGSLNDTITAGKGSVLYAGAGVDTFIFNTGDGAVTLCEAAAPKTAGTNQDVLTLGAGLTAVSTQISRDLSNNLVLAFGNGDQITIENYFGNTGNDPAIVFADGMRWDVAAIASRLVFRDTTSGGQTLVGVQGINNTIVGAPNDTIDAGNLNDTITAGKSNVLYAGVGVDTFVFSAGDGAVTLYDAGYKTAGSNQDILELGAGLTAANTKLSRDASNDLVLAFGNGDQITLEEYFANTSNDPTIVFADGTRWNATAIAGQLAGAGNGPTTNTIVGAPNGTVFVDDSNDTVLVGKNDTIFAGAGVDTFVFDTGSGAVTLNEHWSKTAGQNQDAVRLGAGISAVGTTVTRDLSNNLTLNFGNGDQLEIASYFAGAIYRPSIVFADGTVWNYGAVANQLVFTDTSAGGNYLLGLTGVNNTIVGAPNDKILAGNLNDTITAGKGDTLYDGAGVDTFVFNAGDGAVTLYDPYSAKTAGTNQDVLTLGAGITAANTQISRDLSDDLVLMFGNGDQVTIAGYFANTGSDPAIVFADGTRWDLNAIASQLVYRDTTSGGNYLFGAQGIDNTIVGATNDSIIAGNLNDTITAGKGDTLYAGAGIDTFIFNAGDGAVTLNDSAALKPAHINQDIVKLGAGITAADTQASRDASDNLVLSFGNGDQLTLRGSNTSTAPTIIFADGTHWNFSSIPLKPMLGAMLSPQTVEAGTPWQFALPTGLFTPVNNGDTLTYTATQADGAALPGWLQFDPVKQTFSGTPTDAATGPLAVTIVATESGQAPASTTLNLQVDPTYQAPTVTQPLANQTATGGTAFSETMPSTLFSDAVPGDTLVLTATQSNGSALPGWLSFNMSSDTLSGTPTNRDTGPLALTISATDLGGLITDTTLNLQVNPGYQAPTVTQPLANQTATAGTAFNMTLPATLFNEAIAGDTVTLSAMQTNGNALPGWLNFDANTGTFSGTPTDQTTGPLALKVAATDAGGLSSDTTFNLQVNPTYQAPTVTQTLGAQTLAAGTPWSYALPTSLFDEPEVGDTLTYTATLSNGQPLPGWLSFDPVKQVFSGTPADQATGALALTITATDMGGLAASTTLNVEVNPSYQAPTANQTLATQTIAAGNAWSYTLPASLFSEAVAGDTLTYQATLANGNPLPSWLTFDPVQQTFSGTPTDQTTGSLALTISAIDMGGLATSTTLNVQVNSSYQEPTVSQSLTTQALSVGTAWSYGLPSTLFAEPVDGDTLSYTATLANGNSLPSWLTFDSVNQIFSGVPTDQTTGAFAVKTTATDLGGLATSTTLNLQVNPTYQAPVATQTLPSQSVTTGTAWNYSLPESLFSEAEVGDTLSYSVTLADDTPLPAWLSFDATNLVFSGTPPSGTTGTTAVKITATDMGGLSASTALNIVPSTPANAPAVTQSLSSPTIAAGKHWSYALPPGLFSESVVGDTLAYSATLTNGNPLPSWLTFNPTTLTFSGAPTDQTTGALQLKITATDQGGLSASAPLNVTVNPVYAAPTPPQPLYYATPNESLPLFQMTALGQPWQYTLPSALFTEPVAGDTLTYSATMADGSALPSWLTFDPVHQTFSGTPPGQGPSALNLEITATDMGGLLSSATLTVQLQQNVLNLAAGQTLPAPVGQTAIQEDNPYSNVTADDENHTLMMAGASDLATLGDGNNWIADTGSYDTVTVGNGNNALLQTGASDVVTLGNGNNSITIENAGDITAGNGNNIVTGSGAYESIVLGNGANDITLSNVRESVTAGDGNNIINGSGGSENISVGGGANDISVSGSGATVSTGNGNNVINENGAFETVTVGSGTNTINSTGYYDTVKLGDGTDTVTMNRADLAFVTHGTYTIENCGNLYFGPDTAFGDLWFQRVGQDLQITEASVGGTVTAKNWYAATPEQAYGIYAGDGKLISASGVNQLVQAMAAFAPPAPGATNSTPAEQEALAPVLAANWH